MRISEDLLAQVQQAAQRKDWITVDELLSIYDQAKIADEPELALALCTAWSQMYRHEEADRLLDWTRDRVFSSHDQVLHRRWSTKKASKLVFSGRLDEAEELLNQTAELAERAGDESAIAHCYNTRAMLASYLGNFEEAIANFTRGLAAHRASGNARGVALSHFNIGVTLRIFDKPEEALPYILLAQDGWARCGLNEERLLALTERVQLAACLGDTELAIELSEVALNGTNDLGRPVVRAVAIRSSAAAKACVGQYAEALSRAKAALAELNGSIHNFVIASVMHEAASYAAAQNLQTEAEELWEGADRIFSRMGAEWWRNRLAEKRRIQSPTPL